MATILTFLTTYPCAGVAVQRPLKGQNCPPCDVEFILLDFHQGDLNSRLLEIPPFITVYKQDGLQLEQIKIESPDK